MYGAAITRHLSAAAAGQAASCLSGFPALCFRLLFHLNLAETSNSHEVQRR
jgi:hypothetical protein